MQLFLDVVRYACFSCIWYFLAENFIWWSTRFKWCITFNWRITGKKRHTHSNRQRNIQVWIVKSSVHFCSPSACEVCYHFHRSHNNIVNKTFLLQMLVIQLQFIIWMATKSEKNHTWNKYVSTWLLAASFFSLQFLILYLLIESVCTVAIGIQFRTFLYFTLSFSSALLFKLGVATLSTFETFNEHIYSNDKVEILFPIGYNTWWHDSEVILAAYRHSAMINMCNVLCL